MTSRSTHRHNLPAQVSSFVGREQELRDIARLLAQHRLVTLTGVGGVGKTRLALQAAEVAQDRFLDGVWLVELAALTSAELVCDTIAKVVGVPDAGALDPLDLLAGLLEQRHLLLVLDNCEHLLTKCAHVVAALLARCPSLVVLATSREPLAIRGEALLRVPSLRLPESSDVARTRERDTLLEYDAIRLFVERAQAAEPSFQLTSVSAAPVVEICRRLDGIPLALELAAVRVRGMGVAYLEARLDDRLRLLGGDIRAGEARQRTLAALVDWSYELLDERERVVLRRLCVFRGGFAGELAETVCAGGHVGESGPEALSADTVLDSLTRLVDKSLVQLDQETGRYRLLETIHLYGLERLDESGESNFLSRQHFVCYLQLAEDGAALVGGPGQQAWFARLEQEHDNFRAALDWALAAGRADEAARLALRLWPFWRAHTSQREGLLWLEQIRALDATHPLPAEVRPRLYNALGVLAHMARYFERARVYHAEALRLWTAADDRAGVAQALIDIGWQHFEQLELAQAKQRADESLPLAESSGHQRLIADALLLGTVVDLHAAMALLFGSDTDVQTDPNSLLRLIPSAERCLAIWRELGDLGSEASTLALLGFVYFGTRQYERAKPLLAEAARLHVRLGDYGNINGTLVALMHLAAYASDAPESARDAALMFGVLLGLAQRLGMGPSPWDTAEPAQRLQERLIGELGREGFEQAFVEGKDLTTTELLGLVERITAPNRRGGSPSAQSPSSTATRELHDDLTPREHEVLQLVAQGLSTAQIAQALVVTPRTVSAHLTAIYAKLEVTSRAGAIRYALQHQLA